MTPKGTQNELERRRLRAMALVNKGMSGVKVAKMIGVTSGLVSQWKNRFQRASPEV